MPPIRFNVSPEEYEDGVAELMLEKLGGRASVERNVMLPSKSGGRKRQIDILIRVPVPGMDEILIVVDCKRYGRRVHKKDVESFIGLVNDVGAARGVLVTTQGAGSGAKLRARAEREIHVDVVPVEELPMWEPPLVLCEFCVEAAGPDSLPGMAYIDQHEDLETEGGETVSVVLGYCDRCGGLHLRCPECDTLNLIYEMRTDEWVECEGGCGVEWHLRRMMMKDDLSNPDHDRITLRMPVLTRAD